MQSNHPSLPVVIAGGGVAGLTAALYLARWGLPVTVYEQSSSLGGRARSRTKEGYTFNLGPHALYRLAALEGVLAADITLWSDGGGKVRAARNPIHGANQVARFLLGLLRLLPPESALEYAWINGEPGLIVYSQNRPYSVLVLTPGQERVEGIRIVVNPEKLDHIPGPRAGQ